ncbi:Rid family hydrolase [Paenibacillus sp. 2KB_20]
MSHTAITTTKAPAAIGPYSQAIAFGDAIYTSGMLPIDAEGNLKEGIVDQTHQILKNLRAVLAKAGFSLKEGASACDLICFSCFVQHFTGAISY